MYGPEYEPPDEWDKFFEIVFCISVIGGLLFLLTGGGYCQLAPGAPYC